MLVNGEGAERAKANLEEREKPAGLGKGEPGKDLAPLDDAQAMPGKKEQRAN